MRKSTLVIHGTNLGIMTLDETRYTNNGLEFTLEPNETNVSYDANGGSGKIADQKVTYEKSAKIKANSFKRSGYTFNGWNTKKDGSGKTYSENQDVTTEFPSQNNVTLYAQWKEIKVESIALDKTKIVGEKGKNMSLTADLKPTDAKDKTVSYSSSNSGVASVASNGKLNFVGNGYAEITAKTVNGLTAKCKVSVYTKVTDKNISDIKGYTRGAVNLLDHANEGSSVMRTMAKGEGLSVFGESGSYYYIKADKDKKSGFVLKSKIEIPLVDLEINNSDFTIEKGMKKQLTTTLIPAITTQRKVSWKSSDKSVATVTSTGQVIGKKEGQAEISAIGAKQPSNTQPSPNKSKEIVLVKTKYVTATVVSYARKWVKTGEVQVQGTANVIQGIGGIGNKMYYVKIKKKGDVEEKAVLYKAKITSYKTTVKGKRVKCLRVTGDEQIGELKEKCHYNGIAVQNYKKEIHQNGKTKKVTYTDIFHTITSNTKGKIGKCTLLNDKIKKRNLKIKCTGAYAYKKGGKKHYIEDRCFQNITRVGKYFILKSSDLYFICEPSADRKKMILKNAFKAAGSLEYSRKKTTTQGSAGFAFSDGKYYYICHTFYKKKVNNDQKFFARLCNKSFVFRYRLDNTSDGRVKPAKQYVYRFTGDARRVPWKNGGANKKYKKQKRYFEIEGVYIYKKVAFFLTEGSSYCLDIKGRFSPR